MDKGIQDSIVLDNLTVRYNGCPAIYQLTTHIPYGSLTALIGPNGAGKSTLLNVLAGIRHPSSGRLLGMTGKTVSYLPQHSALDKTFPLSVWDLGTGGLWPEIGATGAITAPLKKRVSEAICRVRLGGFERRIIGSLSGGELQRALFARLIVQDASVILLDEPFNAVDAQTVDVLFRLIREWRDEGRTVIAVTHDFRQARQHFPHALYLAREILGHGPIETVLAEENLQRARQFAAALQHRTGGYLYEAA
jgi:zinc/manganese transport system ATP-binding protein